MAKGASRRQGLGPRHHACRTNQAQAAPPRQCLNGRPVHVRRARNLVHGVHVERVERMDLGLPGWSHVKAEKAKPLPHRPWPFGLKSVAIAAGFEGSVTGRGLRIRSF